MLLEIATTHQPATDLGYLLFKHPDRVHERDLSFGRAVVFYPEAEAERCRVAMLVEVDPVALVRGRSRGERAADATLEQYVNDRPYAATSFMSTAIAEVFKTALNGRCKDRPELAESAIPLEARIASVPCRAARRRDGTAPDAETELRDDELIRRLFEPLGWTVRTEGAPLDPDFPDWGPSPYFDVTLCGEMRLVDLLRHLYVLLPVLDVKKHYWVGDDEVEKLLAKSEEWLPLHPDRDLIVSRYLMRRRRLVRTALDRLADEDTPRDDGGDVATDNDPATSPEPEPRWRSLHSQRLEAVHKAVMEVAPRRVVDLGCGEGRLVARLLRERSLQAIGAMDVSLAELERAERRLKVDRLPERVREKLSLFQGSLLYADSRLEGYDAAALVEVIEHLDPSRLASFERVVFERARPGRVVLTTPNAEYNVRYETLSAGTSRHTDHRFEWTRSEFAEWADRVAETHAYRCELRPVGELDPEVGAPSQMAIFDRADLVDEAAREDEELNALLDESASVATEVMS